MKKLMYLVSLTAIMLFSMMITCHAATYYVSNSGDDSNNGMSEEKAWRSLKKASSVVLEPGDELLLECGGIWNEALTPKGAGAKDLPITLGSYGEGAKPLINAGGVEGLYYGGAVSLFNQSYWTIRDIEVTNMAEEAAWRSGLSVYFEDMIGYGINIQNVTVHDVMGGITNSAVKQMNDSHWHAGISVRAEATKKNDTYIDGVLIENCEIYSVRRTGLTVASNWNSPLALAENGYSRNVTIQNNTLHDIWGDGIIVMGVDGGIIEHNVAYDTNMMSLNGSPSANVGIWGMHSQNLIFRFNESYLCHTTHDGYGFDIDGDNKNITMEYNYSHDNDGGFMLLVNYRNEDFIVRYNISQNDHQWFIASAHFPQSPSSFWNITGKIYNNTMYSKERGLKYILMLGRPRYMEVYNNIFYAESDEISEIPCTYPLNVKRSNNLYYFGNSKKTLTIDEESAIIGKNPLFVAAGSGKTGLDSVSGYRLFEDSPALNSGVVVADNGGRDYFGNPISETEAPNIGAYGGKGVSYADADALRMAKDQEIHLKIGENKIKLHGEEAVIDERDEKAVPIVVNNISMIPVRALCSALDAEITWNYDDSSTVIDSAGDTISFVAGDAFYTVGNRKKQWSEKPVIINNIMYVPLRDLCGEMGKKVVWDNGEIHITENVRVYQ